MTGGGLRCVQLVAGAHFEQQMAKAYDVHVLDVIHVARPHHRIDARVQAKQTVLQTGQSEWHVRDLLRGEEEEVCIRNAVDYV